MTVSLDEIDPQSSFSDDEAGHTPRTLSGSCVSAKDGLVTPLLQLDLTRKKVMFFEEEDNIVIYSDPEDNPNN